MVVSEFHSSQEQIVSDEPATTHSPSVVVDSVPVVTKKKRSKWTTLIIIVVVTAGLGFGGFTLWTILSKNQLSQRPTVANDGNNVITKEEESIAGVVDKVAPSVVSIVTTSRGTSTAQGVVEEEGAGTGIIVGKDGYILTNKHVVSGADTVSVILADGTRYSDAKVLGVDPLNDIAFLKVPDVSNLPAAELGDSTSIRIGQRVAAARSQHGVVGDRRKRRAEIDRADAAGRRDRARSHGDRYREGHDDRRVARTHGRVSDRGPHRPRRLFWQDDRPPEQLRAVARYAKLPTPKRTVPDRDESCITADAAMR